METDFFDIVVCVLQGDTLAQYLFIFSSDNVLRQEEVDTRHKKKSILGTNYYVDNADNLLLLANKPAQAKSLLHSLEWAAGGIGLYVNTDKTEYISLNQRGATSTLNGSSVRLEDKYTDVGSSISSTENDINTRQAKAWTAIDRLSVIRTSDLSDKIKRNFFQAIAVSILLYACTTWTLTKRI